MVERYNISNEEAANMNTMALSYYNRVTINELIERIKKLEEQKEKNHDVYM